jgi:opacity protein-like surface antigen
VKILSMLCVIFLWIPVIAAAQDYPKAEIFAGYSYFQGQRLIAGSNGFDVSATVNFNRWFGVTGDFSGHYVQGAKLHSFLFGPKISFRGNDWIHPYLSTLAGPVHLNFFDRYSETYLGWTVGGGVDIKVHRHIAIRALDLNYLLLRNNRRDSHNGKLSMGIVWRFGGK